ncbi:hypothetical protein [Lactobacillus intestinalis]|uniref:hypothetical protein n=1 Tax=Lactobacillus intestinalis TaxID=151781 RepID=UPI0012B6D061|nr:hypothetical protein [Lactobacillus intestinalis]KAI4315628.1 hypothetical protein C821_000023 [Lactobacillus intestinalis]
MRKILISTVHHPNIMNSELIDVINHLKKYFDNIYLSVSIVTSQNIRDRFKENNINFITIPAQGAADARRKVLTFALTHEKDDCLYLYCDFDKIITAILNTRDEFVTFIDNLEIENGYQIIGRDWATFSTYPDTWTETEQITNKVAADILKISNLDILAGCCAFNSKIGKTIIQNSKEILTDVEWPLICNQQNIELNYVSVSFLIFEYKYNQGRNDYNWQGYIPRLKLALQALRIFKKYDF